MNLVISGSEGPSDSDDGDDSELMGPHVVGVWVPTTGVKFLSVGASRADQDPAEEAASEEKKVPNRRFDALKRRFAKKDSGRDGKD